MKRFFSLLTVAVLLTACSGDSPERQAASVAREYYDRLAGGDVQGFLDGKAGVESLSPAYRQQLLAAVGQYRSDMERKHGGLVGASVAEDHYLSDNLAVCRDTSLHVTYAFLLLSYRDSTQEEVAVPMVETADGWKMR